MIFTAFQKEMKPKKNQTDFRSLLILCKVAISQGSLLFPVKLPPQN